MFTLNIGMKRSDKYGGGTIDETQVRTAMSRCLMGTTSDGGWPGARYSGPHESATEPTMVVHVEDLVLDGAVAARLYDLAMILGQEAIAARDGTHGRLIGPDAAKWGEFDPSQFIMPDGTKLAPPRA